MNEGYAYRYGYAKAGIENALKTMREIQKNSETEGGYFGTRTILESNFRQLIENAERVMEALEVYDNQ